VVEKDFHGQTKTSRSMGSGQQYFFATPKQSADFCPLVSMGKSAARKRGKSRAQTEDGKRGKVLGNR
jgi:hypothetical protein